MRPFFSTEATIMLDIYMIVRYNYIRKITNQQGVNNEKALKFNTGMCQVL